MQASGVVGKLNTITEHRFERQFSSYDYRCALCDLAVTDEWLEMASDEATFVAMCREIGFCEKTRLTKKRKGSMSKLALYDREGSLVKTKDWYSDDDTVPATIRGAVKVKGKGGIHTYVTSEFEFFGYDVAENVFDYIEVIPNG